MGGGNCAFFGCPTSAKHELSLFKLPTVSASDGQHTKELKQKARDEWLRLILRTRKMTPELKTRIERNKILICERHFKPECILTGKLCCTMVYCLFHIQSTFLHTRRIVHEYSIICSLKACH